MHVRYDTGPLRLGVATLLILTLVISIMGIYHMNLLTIVVLGNLAFFNYLSIKAYKEEEEKAYLEHKKMLQDRKKGEKRQQVPISKLKG